jgi:hypothetical protein
MTEVSFWQKYFRNELVAIELILDSGDPELLYGLTIDYCEQKRKSIIAQLIRIQINEHSSD